MRRETAALTRSREEEPMKTAAPDSMDASAAQYPEAERWYGVSFGGGKGVGMGCERGTYRVYRFRIACG